MALRGVKPKSIEKRLKALLYGPAGVGKTTAAIQFPRPYLIDTELGATNDQYVKLLDAAGGAHFFTTDFDELIDEVTSLMTEPHEYRTLVIDPLTVVYNDLVERSRKSLVTKEDPEGNAFGRHKAKADRQVKHLMSLLTRLDMNVIITSHAKTVWGEGMKNLGNTFDCYAKLDYLFDLVFEIGKRGEARVAIVKKTRIESFVEGETFDFSYDAVAERYGRHVLERKTTVESLASAEDVATLVRLADVLKIPADIVDKLLDKAGAHSFAEMSAKDAAKTIALFESKIKGAA